MELTITARDMYTAQTALLSAAQVNDLRARADRVRALCGTTDPETFRVPVRNFDGALIGHMTYTF